MVASPVCHDIRDTSLSHSAHNTVVSCYSSAELYRQSQNCLIVGTASRFYCTARCLLFASFSDRISVLRQRRLLTPSAARTRVVNIICHWRPTPQYRVQSYRVASEYSDICDSFTECFAHQHERSDDSSHRHFRIAIGRLDGQNMH